MDPILIGFLSIIGLCILIFALYKFIKYLEDGIIRVEEFLVKGNPPNPITKVDDSEDPVKDLITFSQPNKGFSFTTLIWFYIKEFNYKYGMRKIIMNKGGFMISILEYSNDLELTVPILNSSVPLKMKYEDLPIQKWICLCVLVDNRHVDLWMNGELYQSKHLENFPKIFENEIAEFVPDGGFSGYLGNVIHFEDPLSKSQIIKYFKQGPVDNSLLSMLRRFLLNTLGLDALFNIKFKLNISVKASNSSKSSTAAADSKQSTS